MDIHFRLQSVIVAFFSCLPLMAIAQPHMGANLSYTILATSPGPLRGYQLMLNYDPGTLHWGHFSIYFDGGYSYFRATHARNFTVVDIYSAAPVFRFSFNPFTCVRPYLEGSIGVSYLNHTHLERRNQGIHFAFQDRLGGGVMLGAAHRVSIGLHAVHYSNAHFSSHNSGITIPIEIDLGIRFM